MRLLIADASSLILLAKCGLLGPLTQAATVLVPGAVYLEVAGPEHVHRFHDARIVADLVAVGAIEVKEVLAQVEVPITLGLGEHEAISLYLQDGADALLTDDGRPIRACRLLGIPFVSSPRVVLDLYRLGRIVRVEARTALERLAVFGRYSPDVMAAAFEQLAAGREDDQ